MWQTNYFHDEMGSPIRLVADNGNIKDTYAYDEFGKDIYENQGVLQPFGYTGYQKDNVAGTYFAQAREYRADEGRFGGEDIIKGSIDMPFSMNHYSYCWGNPLKFIDLNGAWPKLLNDIGNGLKK